MWSKVLIGLGLVSVVGLMAAGVAYAVTGTDADASRAGEGGGRWMASEVGGQTGCRSGSATEAEGAMVRGGTRRATEPAGTGGRRSGEGGLAKEPLVALEGLQTVSGVVESADGSELVLRTEDGERVQVGLGQSAYWETHGVALSAGESIVVEGYYEEDGKLAASWVTIVATGETVVLRDDSGRPMWSGRQWKGGAGTAPAL